MIPRLLSAGRQEIIVNSSSGISPLGLEPPCPEESLRVPCPVYSPSSPAIDPIAVRLTVTN